MNKKYNDIDLILFTAVNILLFIIYFIIGYIK